MEVSQLQERKRNAETHNCASSSWCVSLSKASHEPPSGQSLVQQEEFLAFFASYITSVASSFARQHFLTGMPEVTKARNSFNC